MEREEKRQGRTRRWRKDMNAKETPQNKCLVTDFLVNGLNCDNFCERV